MISCLRGVLLEKQPPKLVLDVAGVGYELEAPMPTFYQLPADGQTVLLYTHLIIREDAHCLYGFHDQATRELFRAVLKINGVGPKLALALLSSLTPDELCFCVQQNDESALVRVPGVGKKTAQRLLIELRDRLGDWQPAPLATPAVVNDNEPVSPAKVQQDALGALIALGYKPQEASKALKQAAQQAYQSVEDLIRLALQAV